MYKKLLVACALIVSPEIYSSEKPLESYTQVAGIKDSARAKLIIDDVQTSDITVTKDFNYEHLARDEKDKVKYTEKVLVFTAVLSKTKGKVTTYIVDNIKMYGNLHKRICKMYGDSNGHMYFAKVEESHDKAHAKEVYQRSCYQFKDTTQEKMIFEAMLAKYEQQEAQKKKSAESKAEAKSDKA